MNNAFLHGAASVDRRIDNLTQLRSNGQKPNGSSGWIAASPHRGIGPVGFVTLGLRLSVAETMKDPQLEPCTCSSQPLQLKVNHLTEVYSRWDLPYRKKQRREVQNKHQIGSPRFFPVLSTEKTKGHLEFRTNHK